MFSIPLTVPRVVYVNMKAPHERAGWQRVSRTLPRDATAEYLYEVSSPDITDIRLVHIRVQGEQRL